MVEDQADYDIYADVPVSEIAKEITKLESQMHQHARDLEFEEAAKVRDKLGLFRERLLSSK